MGVNKSVFASTTGKVNYDKLSRVWADKYHIYHNLPFLNIFNPKDLFDWNTASTFQIDEADHARLKKTSIDYVLCDETETPLVAIDFDGLADGHNVGTSYHPYYPADPWREQITSLKLKVAHGSVFPYFVVASEHFKDLDKTLKMTLVDAIVSDVLAGRAMAKKIAKGFDPAEYQLSQEQFDALTPDMQFFYIDDWHIGADVEATMENNPIIRKKWELGGELGVLASGSEPLSYPPMPDDVTDEERRNFWRKRVMSGSKCTISTPDFGEITTTAWLPEFNVPGYSGLSLLDEIAQLLALIKLKKLRERI